MTLESIKIFVVILIIHWIGDFILQDEKWAMNKWKDNYSLVAHVLTYSLCWLFWLLTWKITRDNFEKALDFTVITFYIHFGIDYVTSRITHMQYKKKHFGSSIPNFGFFTTIGFDQILHYVQLLLTFHFLYGL